MSRHKIRLATATVATIALVTCIVMTAHAAPKMLGSIYHDGDVLRTFGLTSPLPHGGSDPLFVITNGVEGQFSVSLLAPGDPGYSGGDWAISTVTFNVSPYLITSAAQLAEAETSGDVTITRDPSMDFRCPLLP